jgi:hypothetical protein
VLEDLLDSSFFKAPNCKMHILYLRLEGNLFCRSFCHMSTMGADSASQSRLGVAFKACLRYIHMRRRLDHVSHLESTVTINNVLNRHVYFSEHTPECDFNTQECNFSTQSVIFTRSSVISTRIGVILISWSVISIRRV